MAEGTLSYPLTDSEGNEKLRIFSTTGQKYSKDEFKAVVEGIRKSDSVPSGFTLLEPGAMSGVRSGLEQAGMGVEAAGKVVGRDIAPVGFAALLEKLGALRSGRAQQVEGVGERVGGFAGRVGAGMVETPEALGTTAGTIGAGMGTSGMSLPLQVGASALGAGGGRLVGGGTTGGGWDLGRAGIETLIAAATGGFAAMFNTVIGRGMSRVAKEGVASDVLDIFKRKYPHLANDPKLLNMAAADSSNLSTIAQSGMKGLRDDFQAISDGLMDTLNNRAPDSLSRTAASEIRNRITTFNNLTTELAENFADPKKVADIMTRINQNQDDITTAILTEFKSSVDPSGKVINPDGFRAAKEMQAAMQQAKDDVKKYYTTAELLGALKTSGAEGGFNVQRFQREIANRYKASGDMLREAGIAAGRGADLTQGIDRRVLQDWSAPRVLRWVTPMPDRFSLGRKYIGNVQSPLPQAVGTTVGSSTLREMDQSMSDYLK